MPGRNAGEKNPMWGRHHTPETKAKIGNANRGRPSPMKGKKFGPAPEERRLKQSIAHAGKKRTPFTCPKRRGVPRSEETKEKIRVTLTGKMAGKSNPNYRNGASFLPYCEKFNEYIKEQIRNEFNRKCFLCGIEEKYNVLSNNKKQKLSVHHVDLDKGQGCNVRKWLLVPLCAKCHSKSHHHPELLESISEIYVKSNRNRNNQSGRPDSQAGYGGAAPVR